MRTMERSGREKLSLKVLYVELALRLHEYVSRITFFNEIRD